MYAGLTSRLGRELLPYPLVFAEIPERFNFVELYSQTLRVIY
jgi:hypothetical protein